MLAIVSLPLAAGATSLKIGYGAFSLGYAQIWITKEANLFEKNGLDTDVLYLESNLVRTALISGDVPIGAMSGVAMAAPKLQGADLVIILGFQNYLPFRFVVRPEIKTAADLKGKRIGVAGFGLIAERAARIIISKLGLNPAKDVTLLQTGGESTRLAALLGGSIDATVLNPPVYKRAVEAGMRVMANMEDLGYPYLNAALLTTHRFAANNPDVIRRVVKSFIEGTHVSKTNPDVSKRALGKYMRLKTEKEREEAYEILGGFTQRKPYPSLEGIKNILADLNLPAAKTADPKDFVDTRYLEELDRTGFIDGLYR
jgi:NitT/TauT family transport system substrate-binding protein